MAAENKVYLETSHVFSPTHSEVTASTLLPDRVRGPFFLIDQDNFNAEEPKEERSGGIEDDGVSRLWEKRESLDIARDEPVVVDGVSSDVVYLHNRLPA